MMNRVNGFYVLIAVMFVGMLYISGRYFKGSGEASIGIAQTSEYKVKTEKSALVKTINVVPGMQVKEGQLLVELTSDELEVDIAKLANRIAVYKSERSEKAKLANAEISYIRAQKGIDIEEIEAEIKELESEIAMNKALTKEFASEQPSSESTPMSIKVQSLKNQKQKHREAMQIKIDDIRQESTMEQQLLENQISLLESELQLLETEKSKLNKYATAPGVVEKVYVKPGEQVSSYTPLVEINPSHPSTVVAYLIGRKPTDLGVGQIVNVSSYDQRRQAVQGKVIGYGSVRELPEILQKSTATKAFGQQIFIEIPVDNTFFNGEKVLIQ